MNMRKEKNLFSKIQKAVKAFFAPPKEEESHRLNRVLNGLCLLSGSFFLLMYIPYFFWHTAKGHPADTAAALLVFFCVLTPFLFRHPLKKLLKKAYLPLKSIWCAGMCFYMVTFLLFCGVIHTHDDVVFKESDKQTVVVVFGCQVMMDGRPSAELRARLDTAARVLKEHPKALCIAAGGKGDNEPVAESVRMKELLVEKGIDEKRILTEEQSTSTVENMTFSLELLKDHGYDPKNCSFIFVSSGFHTPRILYLGRQQGLSNCATVSSDSPDLFLEFLYTVREYMSYVHLFIFG